jgi:hypothetical protein
MGNTVYDFKTLSKQYGGKLTIACDTEYHGPHTLTAQFAARVGDDIVVQVYSSPDIPAPPDPGDLQSHFPPELGRHCREVIMRPGRRITADLSPAVVLADLYQLRGVERLDPGWLPADGAADVSLTATLVAHFWPADFFRVFGRGFNHSLLEHQRLTGRLETAAGKVLGFREAGGFRDPVIGHGWESGGDEYRVVWDGSDYRTVYRPGTTCKIRARYFDTSRAFGNGGRLEDLARSFLGVGKLEGFGEAEKEDMRATFRNDPVRAYAYAALDAVLTLLVHERMGETHRAMYRAVEFREEDVPPLRPTLGSRVADMAVRCFARPAEGSVRLSRRGRELPAGGAGPLSLPKFKNLLARGSAAHLTEGRLSEFGDQTGQTHGGLNYSRSPTVLFHDAPGRFRDIDLSGCYARVMRPMSLYAGRPVVFEPGAREEARGTPPRPMTLREAVELVREHAAGPDAWFVKASGPVAAFPNALIPSTKDALTNENYRRRAARRSAAPPPPPRYGLAFDRAGDARPGAGNTAIYTDVVEAGVVARPTWLMIQALPPAWRAEYETLAVDSIVFYPRKLVADSGAEYDELTARHASGGTPWAAALDMDALELTVRRRLDADYVSLRCDLGGLARMFQDHRERAKAGGDPAADRAWKEQVNSLYGVLASRYLPTNNVVAANVITATARALALAMQLSLNGVQVITDGCTYRRDQVPAGTLAECLAGCPDYPIDRAAFGGPFLDPASVPDDDAGFTAWYRGHVKRFLGVDGPEYDDLFGRHDLAHKGGAFDGLCCDGSANYVKLARAGGGWAPVDFKARSFQREAKDALAPWLVRAYSTDRYDAPPPVLESTHLLRYEPACAAARAALRRLPGRLVEREPLDRPPGPGGRVRETCVESPGVYYPLGLPRKAVQTYKVIKSSAFLFRTPKQHGAWFRAMGRFSAETGCGLEALALRETSAGRAQGSLAGVAREVYRLIRAGNTNPAKALNLRRIPEGVRHLNGVVRARRVEAAEDLTRRIDERKLDTAAKLTGLFVRPEDILRTV